MNRAIGTAFGLGALVAMLSAQAPTPPAAASGLVVGSGNFFSPIVASLDRAAGFYRDGLGLAVMGDPSNADDNMPLRNMFGLPGARLRWTVAHPEGLRQGVEIVEIAQAGGRRLTRRVGDEGAMTLMLSTSEDLDTVVSRLKAHGGTVISAPSARTPTDVRRAIVEDPDNHFVEVLATGRNAASLPPRIRLTVDDLPRTGLLYAKALGLLTTGVEPLTDLSMLMQATKITGHNSGVLALRVPGSGLIIEFVSTGGRKVTGRMQDPGSTRLQLQVRDLDAAIQTVVAAGGQVISTRGVPVELPAGRGAPIRAAIVRDPDNLFLVLIASGQGAGGGGQR